MKKPAKCTTPKRGREMYSLTARDLHNLAKLVKEANDILAYYINMPENQTGELMTSRTDELEDLCHDVTDLLVTLEEVVYN